MRKRHAVDMRKHRVVDVVAVACALIVATGEGMTRLLTGESNNAHTFVVAIVVGLASGVVMYVHFVPQTRDEAAASTGVLSLSERKFFHDVLYNRYRNWVHYLLRNKSPMSLYLGAQPDTASPLLGPIDSADESFGSHRHLRKPAIPASQFINHLTAAPVRHVLILGEPGAGKTTLLYQLAVALLERAAHDSTRPLAVVFNLASWASKRQPLEEWLAEELASKYKMDKSLASKWVRNVEILLDGLDEVQLEHRGACAQAINDFQSTHGFVSLTVSCRTAEYEDLSDHSGHRETHRVVILESTVAVTVLPLDSGQVRRYVAAEGPTAASVQQMIEHDPALRELVKTPLLLSMLLRAYEGQQPTHLRVEEGSDGVLAQLFDHYVDQMLNQPLSEGGSEHRYPPEKTKQWLCWLARKLYENNQTELYLERLQPDWLRQRSMLGRYSLPPLWLLGLLPLGLLGAFLSAVSYRSDSIDITSAAFGLLYGLVLGMAIGWSFKMEVSTSRILAWSWSRAAAGFIVGSLVSMTWQLLVLLLALLAMFLAFQAQDLAARPWSWPTARTLSMRRSRVLAVAASVGGSAALVFLLVARSLATYREHSGILLPLSLLLSVFLAAFAGISTGQWDERGMLKRSPGIWQSALANMLAGASVAFAVVVVGVGAALLAALADKQSHLPLDQPLWTLLPQILKGGFNSTPRELLQIAVFLAVLMFGLTLPFFGGLAAVQYILVRYRLWRMGAGPWDYPAFLQEAVARKLLQRISSGYRFIHTSLRDHLAHEYAEGQRESDVLVGVRRSSNSV